MEARDDPGREGREGGGAAPQGWACSIGGGEDASRWESVSVSGGAPGLISLPRTQHAARSMQQRPRLDGTALASAGRGESFCVGALAALRYCCLFQSNQHVESRILCRGYGMDSLFNHICIHFTHSHSSWIVNSSVRRTESVKVKLKRPYIV